MNGVQTIKYDFSNPTNEFYAHSTVESAKQLIFIATYPKLNVI
jgi:hypothetical protein